jgi:hypothetical protein
MTAVAAIVVAIELLRVTGPDNQQIEINPQHVVSLRVPQVDSNFPKGTRCLILTADTKFIAVQETCDQIRNMLQAVPLPRPRPKEAPQ